MFIICAFTTSLTPATSLRVLNILDISRCSPMNRGVEIDSAVADSDQAIILEQVLNGVASRMSILYLLLGGKMEEDSN